MSLVGLMIFVSLAALILPLVISIYKRKKIDIAFRCFLLEPDDRNEYLLCESFPASMRPYLRELGQHLRTQQEYGKEQMPFKVPPGTKTITEMAPTKSNDRILPITEEALPYFLRQFDLIARQKALTEAGGGVYYDNKLFIAKPDGSPQRRDRMSANFGQLIRHLEMPHIRFHDLRHTAATNMHQLTGDFYTVGEILGHTLKGIGISLGISTNLEAVTAQYVDVRLERKQSVLQTYHKALQPKTTVTGKEAGQETSKKAKKKSNEMEL